MKRCPRHNKLWCRDNVCKYEKKRAEEQRINRSPRPDPLVEDTTGNVIGWTCNNDRPILPTTSEPGCSVQAEPITPTVAPPTPAIWEPPPPALAPPITCCIEPGPPSYEPTPSARCSDSGSSSSDSGSSSGYDSGSY